MADGWLGNAFIPEAADVLLGPITEGATRAGRSLADLDLVAPVAVEFTATEADGDAAARKHADGYAFTIGAMGTGGGERSDRGKITGGTNFYSDAFTRLGYGDGVQRVTELWQSGRREEARAAVPLDLGRLTNLIGTDEQIAERVQKYRQSGITTLLAKLDGDDAVRLAAAERLIGIVNA
jgi:alkanesulfonate monooxygenase SsuD/methylene tetrahydromethanopterin reductase-like flavin-dependent oxidoreductase (luciferase family)